MSANHFIYVHEYQSENHAKLQTAQDFQDKLEKAQSEILKNLGKEFYD